MFLRTKSGSHYEVNWSARQIRRISGPVTQITPAWRSFEECSPPTVGESLVVRWGEWKQAGERTHTVTSPIVELESEGNA